tara:strand:+ start:2437 stop:2721 length:285 start_codon:yes stop_codon:yes gene_type:complete
MKGRLTTTIELNVDVDFTVTKGYKGDALQPPDPHETEIVSVWLTYKPRFQSKSKTKSIDLWDYLSAEDEQELLKQIEEEKYEDRAYPDHEMSED